MRYKIYIDGDFTNIKSVFIDQTVGIKVKCSICSQVHANRVIVSEDSLKYVDDKEKTNLRINCAGCKSSMGVMIKPPKGDRITIMRDHEPIRLHLSEKVFNSFYVSFLETKKCELVDKVDVDCSVLSDQKVLYENIQIEDGSWMGVDQKGLNSRIDDMEVRYEEVKQS
ncbi:hypothetical protein VCUG_00127 [Vavraia culicis subsp. floridensis]|uniref:Uncharacterized protein n=1 Tax=Vavraia culicis (isolate floridensis) TaxID=948595 RepID=L2GX79_VAVCU|nr:uncharacterized protein VCUG_00127 [Vavraia culicis subsp. floridensis]ELA48291.1 hypothetical protein VCUG_00127 [Vavraia culicis subsp. floridensis]